MAKSTQREALSILAGGKELTCEDVDSFHKGELKLPHRAALLQHYIKCPRCAEKYSDLEEE